MRVKYKSIVKQNIKSCLPFLINNTFWSINTFNVINLMENVRSNLVCIMEDGPARNEGVFLSN